MIIYLVKLSTLLAITLPYTIQAEVYKTQNPDGSFTYSDHATENDSEKIELLETNTIKIKKASGHSYRTSNHPETQTKSKVTISQPNDGQHYRNEQANSIPISAKLTPTAPNLRLKAFHNGSPLDGMTISNPHRGEHTVVVKAINVRTKKVVSTSAPVTFIVHKQIAR